MLTHTFVCGWNRKLSSSCILWLFPLWNRGWSHLWKVRKRWSRNLKRVIEVWNSCRGQRRKELTWDKCKTCWTQRSPAKIINYELCKTAIKVFQGLEMSLKQGERYFLHHCRPIMKFVVHTRSSIDLNDSSCLLPASRSVPPANHCFQHCLSTRQK